MPRTLGYRVTARRGYPNGVGQMFDVYVGLAMDKRLVRGQRGFVKPRWGIACPRVGVPRVRRWRGDPGLWNVTPLA